MLAQDKPLKIKTDFKVNLKSKEVQDKVEKATKQGIQDAVVAIAGDAIKLSPHVTGNNRRSIMFEVGPGKPVAQGELEGAVYSTSGYGGFLETGTVNMAAQPYFKPALDKNIKNLPKNIKTNLSRGF